ncbi:PREDICTED: transcription factor NAI1 isoform X2 [Tarenaya hassleriana]|nr:PREDICTED: transcription factor NAI1 isoform X2 [Tarenaya hassleriana]
MEESSFMDLMDTNEYFIDELDLDSSLFGETFDDTKPATEPNGSDRWEIITDKTQVFEPVCERPTKQVKPNHNTNYSSSPSSSSSSISPSSQLISFGDCNVSNIMGMEQQFRQATSSKKSTTRKQPHTMKEHVIAERKRRQKLNERLIALSALLPGLKKVDKATVLEDAISHVKRLQERVKQLEEEQGSTTKSMESVIFVKRSVLSEDEDSLASSDEQISRRTLPLIEAKVSNQDLLLRILCEKSKGCLGKILSTMEMLQLDVASSFTLPFGNSTLDITILAKMDSNFSRPVKDVVENIRSAIAE